MAIIVKELALEEGLVLQDPYVKPTNISISNIINFSIAIYLNEAARKEQKKYFKGLDMSILFDPSQTVHEQIYKELKNIYKESEDC